MISALTWQGCASIWAAICGVWLIIAGLSARFLLPWLLISKPLEDGPLRAALRSLTARLQFPGRLSVITGGRLIAPAVVVGLGRLRRICLSPQLIATHTPLEVQAVVAHEIGHIRLRHVEWRLGRGVAGFGVLVFSAPHLHLLAFGMLCLTLLLIGAVCCRREEMAADAFAKRACGIAPLIGALKKLPGAEYSSHVEGWFSSHPSPVQRIAAISTP